MEASLSLYVLYLLNLIICVYITNSKNNTHAHVPICMDTHMHIRIDNTLHTKQNQGLNSGERWLLAQPCNQQTNERSYFITQRKSQFPHP